MKIKYLPIEVLTPYENNPRVNDGAVDYVVNSISAFGWRVPIVIDRDKVIICGHTRYKAAKKLGLTELPCVLADDLTPEQADALRLVDNKTQELSTWDMGKLIDELDRLTDKVDMRLFGFLQDDDSDGDIIDVDWGEELDLDDFAADKFKCTCPNCGFKFND